MIRKCSCEHPAQDAFHGKGNRVHTRKSEKKGGAFECTVCGGDPIKRKMRAAYSTCKPDIMALCQVKSHKTTVKGRVVSVSA